MKLILLFSILAALISGCVNLSQRDNIIIADLTEIDQINLEYKPEKAVYSSPTNTLFIMHEQKIDIYRNGKKINVVGGLGFDSAKFNHLSDITIAPDDSFFALDSFDKMIKKFDRNGKFITQFELNDFSEPLLFAVTLNEEFYIYDADRNEIRIFTSYKQNQDVTFGKFQLDSPSSLSINDNYIFAYSRQNKETMIFDKLGQFIEILSGNIRIVKGNKIEQKKYFLESNEDKFGVSHLIWKDFMISNRFVIRLSENSVSVSRLEFKIK